VDVTPYLVNLYSVDLTYEVSVLDDDPDSKYLNKFKMRHLSRLVLAGNPQRAITKTMSFMDTEDQGELRDINAKYLGQLVGICGFPEDYKVAAEHFARRAEGGKE